MICTINSPVIIKGRISGLPIIYESKKAEKSKVDLRDDKKQIEGQLTGFNSKVGFATNVSSSLYALLEEFPVDSLEYNTILNRLKIGRVIQGEIIDSVKGLKVPPFREHWTKYKKITDDMTPEEKEQQKFYNKILCEIRPAFFRFLYPHYMTRYNKEIKKYNIYSHLVFQKEFSEIYTSENHSEKEQELIAQYKNKSFFLDNNSTVNAISHYMRGKQGLVGKYLSASSKDFDYNTLISQRVSNDFIKSQKMMTFLQEYKQFKRGMWHSAENAINNLDAFIVYLRKKCYEEISSNDSELASYAVMVTYAGELSQVDFAWKMFPQGILQNIQENSTTTVKIPIADPNGDIEYLWNKYSMQEFTLEDDERI